MEKLLTTKEVSEILGYKTDPKFRFVRDLWKKGEIEGARFGNRLLFKETSIQDYIDRQFRKQNKRVLGKAL